MTAPRHEHASAEVEPARLGPGSRRGLRLALGALACLAVVALGVYIGWASVRERSLASRSLDQVRALVKDGLGEVIDPIGAQGELMRLGFDEVGVREDGRMVWGTARAPRKGGLSFATVLRDVHVEVALDEGNRVTEILVKEWLTGP